MSSLNKPDISRAKLEISVQLLRSFLEPYLTLEYYHENYPDYPGSWSEKFSCQRCEHYTQYLHDLSTASHHEEECIYRRAHETIEEINDLSDENIIYPNIWKPR